MLRSASTRFVSASSILRSASVAFTATRPPPSLLRAAFLSTAPKAETKDMSASALFSAVGNLVGVLPVHIDDSVVYSSIHDYTVKDLKGAEVPLSTYKGKVVLIVNVASFCGLTKQYAGLQALNDEFGPRGLVILGFPSNTFDQEPGTADEIGSFCSRKYNVSFPIMEKVEVNGNNTTPLYQFLKKNTDKTNINWNFTKFLVDRDGKVIKRFGSRTLPENMRDDIIAALDKQ